LRRRLLAHAEKYEKGLGKKKIVTALITGQWGEQVSRDCCPRKRDLGGRRGWGGWQEEENQKGASKKGT